MTQRRQSRPQLLSIFCGALLLMATSSRAVAAPPPAAVTAFNAYITTVESRLAQQHQPQDAFLAPAGSDPQREARLRRGELIIERIKPSAATSGAMLHHWRGTAFVPGAHAADFERLMRDFDAYPRIFSPQVVRANILAELGNHLQVMMRVRQRHVITVVLDTTYDVTFTQLDPKRGFSISRSTQISEIASPGTATEHALDSSHDHGFMWRLNTYWTYQERDGGLYMQIESVSLTRSIPFGLAWVVGPFVESVPRESLEFTLSHVCTALRDEERTSQ